MHFVGGKVNFCGKEKSIISGSRGTLLHGMNQDILPSLSCLHIYGPLPPPCTGQNCSQQNNVEFW